jgi:hypothetical protein
VPAVPNEELARVAELISTGMMDDERESLSASAAGRPAPSPRFAAGSPLTHQAPSTPLPLHPQPTHPTGRAKVGAIAEALGVTVGEAKHMAYRKKALLQTAPEELATRLEAVAAKAGLALADARRVVALQPGMLLGDAEATKQAEALAAAVKVLAYELRAPQEEIVRLILDNPSVLHGRDARLSAADVAHLASLREPAGRIALD